MKLSRWMMVSALGFVAWAGTLSAVTKAYMTNSLDNTVSVIDTTTQSLIATITVGAGPFFITPTPAGNKLYVTNNTENTLSVIDVQTDAVTATITVGNFPVFIAFAQNKAYVTNGHDNTVSVVDITNQVATTSISVGSGPSFIATTPSGNQLYVLNNGESTVSVIDASSDTVTATVTVDSAPMFVAFTDTLAVVTNFVGGDVSVIDMTTSPPSVTVTLGPAGVGPEPSYVLVSPDKTRAYVIDQGLVSLLTGNVCVIDMTATPPAIVTLALTGGASFYAAITSDGNKLYVPTYKIAGAGPNSGSIVDVISTATDLIDVSVGVQYSPVFDAISPDGKSVYVANTSYGAGGVPAGQGSVNVIDIASDTVTATISVGLSFPGDTWLAFAGFSTGPSVPTSPSGRQTASCFFDQIDLINVIQWVAPTSGTAVQQYNIYRDAALTDLAGIVPASQLMFTDHNRKQNQTYTYYIVAVDAGGGKSPAATTTVTPSRSPCR